MDTDQDSRANDPAWLLRPDQAARFIAMTPRALEAWRCRGGGPRYVKVSAHCVRYRRQDLVEWAEQRLRSTTQDSFPGSSTLNGDIDLGHDRETGAQNA